MSHATLLDGLKLETAPRSQAFAPTLLRYDLGPDVIESFFRDLRGDDWLAALKARSDLPTRFDLPLVDQHLHRKAVIVAVDAACLQPGFPRLDPAKVTQAGLVVRREVEPSNAAPEGAEVWAADAASNPLGWVGAPVGAVAKDSRFEPDAARRRARLASHNPVLRFRTRITGDADGVSETVHSLFAIPPDIAQKIGRTIYFSMLPTTSMAVVPAEAPPPPFALDDVKARVPNLLQHERDASLLPPTGTDITQAQFGAGTIAGVAELRSTLTRLGQEYGMFTGAPAAATLRAELAKIAIEGVDQPNLRDWLDAANAVLVEKRDPAGGPTVSYLDRTEGPDRIAAPLAWPAITEAAFDAIAAAVLAAMTARWADLSPTVTRFGPPGDRYHVRCFVRIDDDPGCPPRILWSPLSQSYTIRPWYESGGAPPQQIDLPNLKDLSNLKPDVAVKVPPEIQQFMDRLNLDGLLNGDAPKTSLSFGMICGFSIPIITICAFIILQIFLGLLNIVFSWLAFVKICIPYPTIETDEDGG